MSERVEEQCQRCAAPVIYVENCGCDWHGNSFHYEDGHLMGIDMPRETYIDLGLPVYDDRPYQYQVVYLCDACLSKIARFVFAGGDL